MDTVVLFQKPKIIPSLPEIACFSIKYCILGKVYTNEDGKKIVVGPPVQEIIHSLTLMD